MTNLTEPLPAFLAEPSRIGGEISVTGKWVPSKQGGRFRTTDESTEMLAEWEDIHSGARAHPGVLSTEVNHAVGEDAVLVHHVFADADALVDYFATTATQHLQALTAVATPQIHLVRGLDIPSSARDAVESKGVPVAGRSAPTPDSCTSPPRTRVGAATTRNPVETTATAPSPDRNDLHMTHGFKGHSATSVRRLKRC